MIRAVYSVLQTLLFHLFFSNLVLFVRSVWCSPVTSSLSHLVLPSRCVVRVAVSWFGSPASVGGSGVVGSRQCSPGVDSSSTDGLSDGARWFTLLFVSPHSAATLARSLLCASPALPSCSSPSPRSCPAPRPLPPGPPRLRPRPLAPPRVRALPGLQPGTPLQSSSSLPLFNLLPLSSLLS